MDLYTILLRFSITFVFSLIFGLERQRSHKPIGFGTFVFVAMGSCGLGLIAITMNVDNPLPLLAAIVTGIGFLGAGALIKTTDKVFGFTTAAGIWVFAIIGLIIATGNYLIGSIIYISVWFVAFIDKYLAIKGIGPYQKKLNITINKNVDDDEIFSLLGVKKHKIVDLNVNRVTKKITMTILIEGHKDDINKIPARLYKESWVDSFKLE